MQFGLWDDNRFTQNAQQCDGLATGAPEDGIVLDLPLLCFACVAFHEIHFVTHVNPNESKGQWKGIACHRARCCLVLDHGGTPTAVQVGEPGKELRHNIPYLDIMQQPGQDC